MRLSARLTGVDGLATRLKLARTRLDGQALEYLAVRALLPVVERTKEGVPKVSHDLEHSYHVGGHTEFTPDFEEGHGYSDIRGNRHGAHSAEVLAGTNIAYGRRVEFGFNGADNLGRVYHQAAQPALRPAFDELRAEVTERAAAGARRLAFPRGLRA